MAVGISSVTFLQPQLPEEALLVKDEREASPFIVHLVLLCWIQATQAASFWEEGTAEYQVKVKSGLRGGFQAVYLPKMESVSNRFSVHAAEIKHTLICRAWVQNITTEKQCQQQMQRMAELFWLSLLC